MAFVVCNKANLCNEIGCQWHSPRQEAELGNCHCKKWEQQTGLGGHNITIVPTTLLSTSDPNLAFARRKHGL